MVLYVSGYVYKTPRLCGINSALNESVVDANCSIEILEIVISGSSAIIHEGPSWIKLQSQCQTMGQKLEVVVSIADKIIVQLNKYQMGVQSMKLLCGGLCEQK